MVVNDTTTRAIHRLRRPNSPTTIPHHSHQPELAVPAPPTPQPRPNRAKREVLAVRQLFDERFGTRGRSLALINHESTISDIPLATVPNLKHVLLHLGRRVMDTKQDTLFLFLTSHGEKGVLTVALPGYSFPQLTPGELKTMLDDSGIR